MDTLVQDWRTAALSARDHALLTHVERLTLAPASTTPADLDVLRTHGFDDTAILQLTAIAGFFAYVNRMADGLGVGRPLAGAGDIPVTKPGINGSAGR